MSTETEPTDVPDDAEQASTDEATETTQAGDDENVEVSTPEFQEVADDGNGADSPSDLNRFQDIKVVVSADLGRAEVPIETLMNLGEGSVLELNREIDSPVELVAQGVPLACGEVVVVEGCFAIRVTKVYQGQKA